MELPTQRNFMFKSSQINKNGKQKVKENYKYKGS